MIARAQKGDLFARKEVHKIFNRAMNDIVFRRYGGTPQSISALRMEVDNILDKALDSYNPTYGYKPLTYLRTYVETKIGRYFNQNARQVNLVEKQNLQMSKFNEAVSTLNSTLGRPAVNTEILAHMQENYPKTEHLKIKDIDRMLKETRFTSFGSSVIGAGDEGSHLTMEDVVYTEHIDNPLEDYMNDLKASALKQKLETLPEPQKTITKHYYGFDGYAKLSLRAIATKFGINKYRVQEYLKEAEVLLR